MKTGRRRENRNISRRIKKRAGINPAFSFFKNKFSAY
nr:MAG TPA: hypothetical protein [Caudoviricetes sp.]